MIDQRRLFLAAALGGLIGLPAFAMTPTAAVTPAVPAASATVQAPADDGQAKTAIARKPVVLHRSKVANGNHAVSPHPTSSAKEKAPADRKH
jgi:hypothetical protein